MFRKFLFCLMTCLSFAGVNAAESEVLSYNVQMKVFPFSTVFEMTSPRMKVGSVVKSAFRVRTNYDFYDNKGNHKATAICRILTLGLFYDWGTEMDVYDPLGNYLGFIDGQVVTGASAKFSFYDRSNNHVGIAYLDCNNTGFTISHPGNEYFVIAQYSRRFVENTVDSWDVSIYDSNMIPAELLHIFGAFAVDRQGSFKPDT